MYPFSFPASISFLMSSNLSSRAKTTILFYCEQYGAERSYPCSQSAGTEAQEHAIPEVYLGYHVQPKKKSTLCSHLPRNKGDKSASPLNIDAPALRWFRRDFGRPAAEIGLKMGPVLALRRCQFAIQFQLFLLKTHQGAYVILALGFRDTLLDVTFALHEPSAVP